MSKAYSTAGKLFSKASPDDKGYDPETQAKIDEANRREIIRQRIIESKAAAREQPTADQSGADAGTNMSSGTESIINRDVHTGSMYNLDELKAIHDADRRGFVQSSVFKGLSPENKTYLGYPIGHKLNPEQGPDPIQHALLKLMKQTPEDDIPRGKYGFASGPGKSMRDRSGSESARNILETYLEDRGITPSEWGEMDRRQQNRVMAQAQRFIRIREVDMPTAISTGKDRASPYTKQPLDRPTTQQNPDMERVSRERYSAKPKHDMYRDHDFTMEDQMRIGIDPWSKPDDEDRLPPEALPGMDSGSLETEDDPNHPITQHYNEWVDKNPGKSYFDWMEAYQKETGKPMEDLGIPQRPIQDYSEEAGYRPMEQQDLTSEYRFPRSHGLQNSIEKTLLKLMKQGKPEPAGEYFGDLAGPGKSSRDKTEDEYGIHLFEQFLRDMNLSPNDYHNRVSPQMADHLLDRFEDYANREGIHWAGAMVRARLSGGAPLDPSTQPHRQFTEDENYERGLNPRGDRPFKSPFLGAAGGSQGWEPETNDPIAQHLMNWRMNNPEGEMSDWMDAWHDDNPGQELPMQPPMHRITDFKDYPPMEEGNFTPGTKMPRMHGLQNDLEKSLLKLMKQGNADGGDEEQPPPYGKPHQVDPYTGRTAALWHGGSSSSYPVPPESEFTVKPEKFSTENFKGKLEAGQARSRDIGQRLDAIIENFPNLSAEDIQRLKETGEYPSAEELAQEDQSDADMDAWMGTNPTGEGQGPARGGRHGLLDYTELFQQPGMQERRANKYLMNDVEKSLLKLMKQGDEEEEEEEEEHFDPKRSTNPLTPAQRGRLYGNPEPIIPDEDKPRGTFFNPSEERLAGEPVPTNIDQNPGITVARRQASVYPDRYGPYNPEGWDQRSTVEETAGGRAAKLRGGPATSRFPKEMTRPTDSQEELDALTHAEEHGLFRPRSTRRFANPDYRRPRTHVAPSSSNIPQPRMTDNERAKIAQTIYGSPWKKSIEKSLLKLMKDDYKYDGAGTELNQKVRASRQAKEDAKGPVTRTTKRLPGQIKRAGKAAGKGVKDMVASPEFRSWVGVENSLLKLIKAPPPFSPEELEELKRTGTGKKTDPIDAEIQQRIDAGEFQSIDPTTGGPSRSGPKDDQGRFTARNIAKAFELSKLQIGSKGGTNMHNTGMTRRNAAKHSRDVNRDDRINLEKQPPTSPFRTGRQPWQTGMTAGNPLRTNAANAPTPWKTSIEEEEGKESDTEQGQMGKFNAMTLVDAQAQTAFAGGRAKDEAKKAQLTSAKQNFEDWKAENLPA